MTKSATDVMQEIIFAAVVDSLDALKAASRGVPNTLLRDIGAVHTNATFADLPKELQAAITASVRSAFNRLLKEGYSVSPGRPEPQRRPEQQRRPDQPRRPPSGGAPVRRGGRPPPKNPNRTPKPRGPK
jgi:hypothetical protein